MSFTDLIKIIEELDVHHKINYNLFIEIIRELQPIAFLISASLVLSVFFLNSDKDSISGKYALLASISFFFAYLGFAFYKISNYRLSFYWGLSLILISVILIYASFGGVLSVIFSSENKIINTLVTYIISSLTFLAVKLTLDFSNKKNFIYKINMNTFYIILLFVIIYVPIAIYFNLTSTPWIFALCLLILIIFISIFNDDKSDFNPP